MKDITSERIKERRVLVGLTQEELGKKVGYTNRSSIYKIEKSAQALPIDKLKDIANALDVSPDYLMGWTDDPTPEPAPKPKPVPKQKEAPTPMDKRLMVLDMFTELPDDKKEDLLKYLEFLVYQSNQ